MRNCGRTMKQFSWTISIMSLLQGSNFQFLGNLHWGGKNPGLVVKNLLANAGDASLIPGSGRYPGEGNGNPLQYSCLENPMDSGAWQTIVHGVTRLSD